MAVGAAHAFIYGWPQGFKDWHLEWWARTRCGMRCQQGCVARLHHLPNLPGTHFGPGPGSPFDPGRNTAHQLFMVCVHGSTEGTGALYRAQIPIYHHYVNPMMFAQSMLYGSYMGRHDMGRHVPVATAGKLLWCACLVLEPCGVSQRLCYRVARGALGQSVMTFTHLWLHHGDMSHECAWLVVTFKQGARFSSLCFCRGGRHNSATILYV